MLIVYGGAFNPLTAAHQAAIRTLSQRYPGAQIILLPSGEQFVKLWKPDQDVLPDVIRLDILSAFVRESGLTNVQIDTLAMARNLCTYDALHELKKKYHQDDARFVIGMDKLPELPRWAHAEALLRECTFILLAYADDQPDLPAGARIETLLLPMGTEDIHASALRNRMARHDPTVVQEPLVGPVLSRYPECLRLCALSPRVHLGDPQANAQAIIQRAQQMDGDVLLFPELSICGYTCGDLFVSPVFVRACAAAAGDEIPRRIWPITASFTSAAGLRARMRLSATRSPCLARPRPLARTCCWSRPKPACCLAWSCARTLGCPCRPALPCARRAREPS